MSTEASFYYLNQNNGWPAFQLNGLVIAEDALQLAQVPGNAVTVGPILDPAGPFTGPTGIDVDRYNNLYLVDPAQLRVIRIDGCDGRAEPLRYLRGPGHEPGQLQAPRGLVVGPRQTLYIADSGNHRVQVIDLRTGQVRAIWGQSDPLGEPQPGAEPGQLNEPWDVAADADGSIYVVDYGNHRLQKFQPGGQVVADFWTTVQSQAVAPQEPMAIRMVVLDGEERLLVIDQAVGKLLLYQRDGRFDAAATERWQAVTAYVTTPVTAIADEHSLYVGNASGQIFTFDRNGVFLGLAHYDQPTVAGLAFDCQGRLLVHPGNGGAVQRLTPAAAYTTCGTFLAGPFTTDAPTTHWQRLTASVPALASGAHIQLFTLTSQTLDGAVNRQPLPPITCAGITNSLVAISGATLTPLDHWRPAATDAVDFLIRHENATYLWLAGLFQGDSTSSPTLAQIRLTYNTESWLRYLPAVYRPAAAQPTFFENALRLFESMLADSEAQITNLPVLFDPYAAPNEDAPNSWLDWLASWLAFDLDERWDEATRRRALAQAFALYSQRGTVASLRGLIALYAGATAHISEPARLATLWSLGESSYLGFDTMLAPAHAQGAVVGSTATLGQSHLIEEADYGAPLFEDVAHRFCVQVYAADLPDAASVARVTQVIEREKPAHTEYHLCLIEAKLRVGFQARLGIDTIVAGAPPDLTWDGATALGFATVLPPAPDSDDGAIGRNARVGVHTQLLA